MATTNNKTTANNETTPNFRKAKRYSDYIKLSTKFTDLDPTRQGPALAITLKGKGLDTILNKGVSYHKGVNKIIAKLNSIHKKG